MKTFVRNFNLPTGDSVKGNRILLRHPDINDLNFIDDLWTDAETMEAVGGVVCWSMEELENWYKRKIDPGGFSDCYFLIFKSDLIPIGEVSFHRWIPGRKAADLNIKIKANYRRKGYASEAMKLFLGYFFDTVGGNLLVDDLLYENINGRKLMESLNFKHDIEYTDAYRMIMSKENYLWTVNKAQRVAGGDRPR
jgi:RimJ/RimL family protein N-acetyltransferase